MVLEDFSPPLVIALQFYFVDFLYWLLDLPAAVVVGPPFGGTSVFGDYAAFYELTAPSPQCPMVAERIAVVFVIEL